MKKISYLLLLFFSAIVCGCSVPRMRQDEDRAAPWFVWMTKLEWAIGAVVLVIISLLATLEPF